MLEFNSFEAIKIGLASPETIKNWSYGEVLKPETINYRTLKPEKDGLFCEKIFGPTKDWECHCGKYKKIRFKGKVCERCGVEVTKSKVRRERMGHIELATPVSHIWYFKGVLSSMGLILDLSPRQLEKVLYFASYIVTDPGRSNLMQNQILSEREYREAYEKYGDTFKAGMGAESIKTLLERINLEELSAELKEELEASQGQKKARIIKRLEIVEAFRISGNRPEWMILTIVPVIPPELRPMVQLDGGRFATSDLNDLYRRVINRNNRLKRLLELGAPDIIIRNEKRMLQEAVDALINNGRRGRTVTGPGNRPLKSLSDMLKGKQGRFRQNLLGKRVDYSGRSVIVVGPELKIYQCGLPKEMAIELFKPFVMKELVSRGLAHNIKSAKRMVERTKPEVWDVLEDVIKEHPVLLNRAPTLHRLGIQAFEPRLVEGRALKLHPLVCTAYNADFDGDQMAVHVPLSPEAQAEARFLMLSANNLLKPQDGHPVTVPTQDMILGSYYLTLVKEHYDRIIDTLLNDEAKLGLLRDKLAEMDEEENFIIYNEEEPVKSFTDLEEALRYVRELPEVAMNETEIHGNPITLVMPEKTLKISLKKLISEVKALVTKKYISFDEAILAYENKEVTLHERIKVEVTRNISGKQVSKLVDATVGRIIFNNNIPQNLGYVDRDTNPFDLEVDFIVEKKQLGKIIDRCIRIYGTSETADVLDKIKATGYKYSTKGAITVAVSDIHVPEQKKEILERAEKEVEGIMQKYRFGLLTNEERYQQVIKIWAKASSDVTDAMMKHLGEFNPIFMMADSGARGSVNQIRQLAAMRGLMADTQGRTVEIPIRANFREGLNVLEYFISSHGARKGLTDTALRTADSGYLTRRLVDVSQDIIVREIDCGTDEGEWVTEITDGKESIEPLYDRIVGRTVMEDIIHPETGKILARGGELISDTQAMDIINAGITKVYIRSVLTCKSKIGVCAKCYGTNLATGELVNVGEAVGIIAAQSIGEPGTQLTMRTFHAGGVASSNDITQGLPRVEELFEARRPKGVAIISEIGGVVTVSESKHKREVTVTNDAAAESKTYTIPYGLSIKVHDGDIIEAGDELTAGSVNPNDLLHIKGPHAVQVYIAREVQRTYRMQGVDINDKHVEVITRQMLRKVRVEDAGDTDLLIGALIDIFELDEANKLLDERAKQDPDYVPNYATHSPVLLGITKAALATESWLSAASFQETTKVLTDAAIKSKVDPLLGIKENVIIGKLIPAGTGMSMYKNINITVDGNEIPNEECE
ncbi:MAG: DNA-directed RNA polymerase subunit beta' [Oscillospiraceae bacterium]|nr:DNA-directed RNA polymerase subunit beta' [Oscillospiraceae bacterium]